MAKCHHAQRQASSMASMDSGFHLLIVEDVPEDAELIALTLESAQFNFTYDITSTYEQCLQLLSTRSYHAVLSDYRLPYLNGLQVFELLKDSIQEIPFILITGSLGEEAAVECIKAGMTDYVLKDRLFRLPTVLKRALHEFTLRRQQQAAVAQIHRQAWRETTVNRIVQAMRETLILEEVLQITVNQLHEALDVNLCTIFQPDDNRLSSFTIQYISQATIDHSHYLGKSCAFAPYYYKSLVADQAVILNDCQGDDVIKSVRRIACVGGCQSIMLMPLLYQKIFFGGICLQQCDRQRDWTEDEILLVRTIAQQCVISVYQVQLYQQAQTELAERKKIEAQLRHDALHDTLTGLPNRALLVNRLEHAIQISQRRLHRQYPTEPFRFAVLFLDLDRFKVINDSLGHDTGDQLLKIVSEKIQSCLRASDTASRFGGDEFVILLEDIQHNTDAIDVAYRIQERLKVPLKLKTGEKVLFAIFGVFVFLALVAYIILEVYQFVILLEDIQHNTDAIDVAYRIQERLKVPLKLKEHEVYITTSIGIALNNDRYLDAAQILRDADIAMYRAKRHGRDSYVIFNSYMYAQALRQLQLENDLQRSIEKEELEVHYQPIVSLKDYSIEGFEALVRWQHPKHGIVSPSEFIPVAEDIGLINSIDLWVLGQTCSQLKKWEENGQNSSLSIGINLSGRQFSNHRLIDHIDEILEESKISGSQLKVEITESVLIENSEAAATILEKLRDRGIRICLDDFGTGYSSLSYLHRFPIDTIKIDRFFINTLKEDKENLEIVKAIVNLAFNLGQSVVAEGVETAQQLAYLQSIQCPSGQGYYFAKPLDSKAALALLRKHIP